MNEPPPPFSKEQLSQILEAGFWAPNGDNLQPWHIQVHADLSITISAFCQQEIAIRIFNHDEGHPTLLCVGALIENITLAAQELGYGFQYNAEGCHQDANCQVYTWHGTFSALPHPQHTPLAAAIPQRRVDRMPFSPSRLSPAQQDALKGTLQTPGVDFAWSSASRWFWASAQMLASRVRVLLPTLEQLNVETLDFKWANSAPKMPAATLFLEPLTKRVMQWAVARPWTLKLLRKLPLMTAPLTLQMDYFPALMSGGYMLLIDRENRLSNTNVSLRDRQQFVTEIGRDMQRLWLTAQTLGLSLQPMYSTLIFPALTTQQEEAFHEAPAYLKRWLDTYLRRLHQHVFVPLKISNRQQILFAARLGKTLIAPNKRPHSVRKPLTDVVSFDETLVDSASTSLPGAARAASA